MNVNAGLNDLIPLQKKEDQFQPAEDASRSLTEMEKRYSLVEKKAPALRWA